MLTNRAVRRSLKHRLRRARSDEEGAIVVIWAVSLVALFSLTAMAVDLGNISQTKQHTQNAAQAAVLAAVVDIASLYPGGTSNDNNAGPGVPAVQEALAVSDAESYLTANYPSLANANFATGCSGKLPSSPLSMYIWPADDCFGFFNPQIPADNQSNPTAMAVAVPSQTVNYTFGRAGGLTSQAVSGVAYASLKTADNGFTLPFSYSANGPLGLECLKTGSGKKAGLCTGFATGSGNFGVINSPRYLLYPGSSNSGGASDAVIQTDADIGLDHELEAWQTGEPIICDAVPTVSGCNNNYNNTPPYLANYANVQTGQTTNLLAGALFTGGVTTPDGSCVLGPRLNHTDGFVATGNCATDSATGSPDTPYLKLTSGANADTFGSTYSLNGVNISKYLDSTDPNTTTINTACASKAPSGGAGSVPIDSGYNGTTSDWTTYDDCLSNAIGTMNGPIFSASIEKSPRFGVVPLIANANGTGAVEITGFLATYLDLVSGSGTGATATVASVVSWIFPTSFIDGAASSGAGLAGFEGGPYVDNLCNFGANC